jgi:hypothetical protein
METTGKYLIIAGIILIFTGALVWGFSRINIPLGQLPGDLKFEGKNVTVYIPCATSIILSIILTIVLSLIAKLMNR